MKSLMILAVSMCFTSTFASTLICSTMPEATPSDVFIINISDKTEATVQYQRYPFFGAEILPFTQNIQGCNPAQLAIVTDSEVYVECDGDGDAGFLSLKITEAGIAGTVNFPEGNIGYSEDTSLAVTCRQQ